MGRMQSLFCRTPPCGSSRPMDQSGAPAGLQARRSGGVHNFPVARPDTALRRVMGLLLPGEQATTEQRSPVCSTGDQRHLPGELCCRTAGCERGLVPMQVATRPRETKNHSAASTVRDRCIETGIGLSACAGSEVALGESRLRGSQASLNSNCRKTGESTFHLERRCTLHAGPSSTLSNSTNGWRAWQWRSYGEDDEY